MKIDKIAYQDLPEYPILYSSIFDKIDPHQIPAFIYVGYESDFIGFISGYNHNATTVYIQYGGLLKELRGEHTLDRFNEVLEYIHKEYKGIMLMVENTNIKALKLMLSAGFKIIGGRVATDGTYFVEFIKER